MQSGRAVILERVQEHLNRSKWKAAIVEWEKLFDLDQDPLVRVRIGDLKRRLGRTSEAVRDYALAAELFLARGFVGKALAQYRLVLRLDASNADVRIKREMLRMLPPPGELKREPAEYRAPADFEYTLLLSSISGGREGRIPIPGAVVRRTDT